MNFNLVVYGERNGLRLINDYLFGLFIDNELIMPGFYYVIR